LGGRGVGRGVWGRNGGLGDGKGLFGYGEVVLGYGFWGISEVKWECE